VRADVLKVPHHGSMTSSGDGFLRIVQPSLAVVSVGLDNHFRFPAREVEARYADLGIPLLRTDRGGAVHLTVDEGGRIAVERFGKGRPADAGAGGQSGGSRSRAVTTASGNAARGRRSSAVGAAAATVSSRLRLGLREPLDRAGRAG